MAVEIRSVGMLDDFSREYSVALRDCSTLTQLRALVVEWRPFARDAYAVVWHGGPDGGGINPAQFEEFRRGLAKESKGKYAGDEWNDKWSVVVMPEIMFRAAVVAVQFKAPWGVAFNRLKDVGRVVLEDGVYVWKEPERAASEVLPLRP